MPEHVTSLTAGTARDTSDAVIDWEASYRGLNIAFSALFRQWTEADDLLGLEWGTDPAMTDNTFHVRRMRRIRALLALEAS
jgi:hypothetical protein